MLQVRGGQGSEQRRQRAPHLAEVLQKPSVKRFSTTSCNGLRTPREGIRLSELAGLRCSDVGRWQREITVRGKGGKDRIVKIGHQATRSLDRYHPRPLPARPGLAAPAVARSRQPGTAGRLRHLPDDHPAAADNADSRSTPTGSGTTSATPG
jgi:integrase